MAVSKALVALAMFVGIFALHMLTERIVGYWGAYNLSYVFMVVAAFGLSAVFAFIHFTKPAGVVFALGLAFTFLGISLTNGFWLTDRLLGDFGVTEPGVRPLIGTKFLFIGTSAAVTGVLLHFWDAWTISQRRWPFLIPIAAAIIAVATEVAVKFSSE